MMELQKVGRSPGSSFSYVIRFWTNKSAAYLIILISLSEAIYLSKSLFCVPLELILIMLQK